ncbi:MAG: VWA domain-containing protein [Archangium sp.]|nr:VWA domain-containing protein [Archangium sp.]
MSRTAIFLLGAFGLVVLALLLGKPSGAVAPVHVEAPLKLTARVSHPLVPVGTTEVFVTADVRAADASTPSRGAVNLALVIDRSGSMAGFKLEHAKAAAKRLVELLTPADRLAIVQYGSDVKVMSGVLATTANKQRLSAYIDSIYDDGGTNLAAGLVEGAAQLRAAGPGFAVSRVILISDGQPTEGVTDTEALLKLARGARGQGQSLSSIGVGDDFNETLMEGLAELGGGAYAFLSDASELSNVFQRDLHAASTQVARAVTVSFYVPPGVRFNGVLGHRDVTTSGANVTVSLPDFAAGQAERVVAHFTVTAEAAGETVSLGQIALEAFDARSGAALRDNAVLAVESSGRADDIFARRDKEATVFATRALAGVNLQAAAEAARNGDRGKAEQLMRANAQMFEEAANVAGAPAVEADLRSQRALHDKLDSAADDAAFNAYSKEARSKARVDFGLMGSTY